MFYVTSVENFEKYSDEYNANQAGPDSGYAQAADLHQVLADDGWQQMEVAENLKRQGAYSVWERSGEGHVVFEA